MCLKKQRQFTAETFGVEIPQVCPASKNFEFQSQIQDYVEVARSEVQSRNSKNCPMKICPFERKMSSKSARLHSFSTRTWAQLLPICNEDFDFSFHAATQEWKDLPDF